MLAAFYEQIKEEDQHALEIVFVSSDHDEGSFRAYYASMPWVAIPFEKRDIAQSLGERFRVEGIPTLIILDRATGAVKDSDARTTVATARGNTAAALRRW